jgi:hypothetical protein
MSCSDPHEEATCAVPKNEVEKDDLIEGIAEGLKDFAKGRYTVFEDDDELKAYLMSL